MSTPSLSQTVPRIGLNRAEVASSIGVSANTVDRMVEEGYLPKPKKWHSRKLWLVSEVITAMAAWPEDGIKTKEAMEDSNERWNAIA